MSEWKGKRVLITGVCGTVGRELLRQVVTHNPADVVGLDNNESEVFFLGEEYRNRSNVRLFLGDLRDRDKLLRMFRGVDVVLHAAALKHVILCEQSPRDAIQTNIIGTQNVIDAACENDVQRVIFTSTDKAVNPTNVMGTSKLMCERLMTAANAHGREPSPVFASTRFGNVLGSHGSVIPLFEKQIANGGPLTLTDPAMTRFVMTLEDSVRLVMDSVFLAKGGEVFVTKMPVIRIKDLAEVMIEELAPHCGRQPEDIAIDVIGQKAGEKLYEELMNEEEVRRTFELGRFFVVTPAFKCLFKDIHYEYADASREPIMKAYNSVNATPLTKEELRAYTRKNHLLGRQKT